MNLSRVLQVLFVTLLVFDVCIRVPHVLERLLRSPQPDVLLDASLSGLFQDEHRLRQLLREMKSLDCSSIPATSVLYQIFCVWNILLPRTRGADNSDDFVEIPTEPRSPPTKFEDNVHWQRALEQAISELDCSAVEIGSKSAASKLHELFCSRFHPPLNPSPKQRPSSPTEGSAPEVRKNKPDKTCQLPFVRLYDRRTVIEHSGSSDAGVKDQCNYWNASSAKSPDNGPSERPFSFTPNRQWYTNESDFAFGVVLPMLGYSWAYLEQLALVLPDWHRHFLGPTKTPLLVLSEDAGGIPLDFVEATLGVRQSQQPCHLENVDLGYKLFEYEAEGFVSYILLGNVSLPRPEWVVAMNKTNQEVSRSGWLSTCYPREYFYIYGTCYYAYDLLRMEIANYFDFFWKLDADTFFKATVPLYQPEMIRTRSSAGYYIHRFEDGTCVWQTLDKFGNGYLKTEGERCGVKIRAKMEGNPDWFSHYFHGNFFLFWLGYYQSPEVMHFGQQWNSHLDKWSFRWGDQQYFWLALGLTSGLEKALKMPLDNYHDNDVFKSRSPVLSDIPRKQQFTLRRELTCTHYFQPGQTYHHFDEVRLEPSGGESVEINSNNQRLLRTGIQWDRILLDVAYDQKIQTIGRMVVDEYQSGPASSGVLLRQVFMLESCTGIYPIHFRVGVRVSHKKHFDSTYRHDQLFSSYT